MKTPRVVNIAKRTSCLQNVVAGSDSFDIHNQSGGASDPFSGPGRRLPQAATTSTAPQDEAVDAFDPFSFDVSSLS